MIVTLAAIGRLRQVEPEQALALDWIARADATGRACGFKPVRLVEIDARTPRPDPEREAAALLARREAGAALILLDGRGSDPGSDGFARQLAVWRESGRRELMLAVGGADGHGEAARAAADGALAFGSWVWPHRLARAMAAEQLYRAVTILAGLPYHRA